MQTCEYSADKGDTTLTKGLLLGFTSSDLSIDHTEQEVAKPNPGYQM